MRVGTLTHKDFQNELQEYWMSLYSEGKDKHRKPDLMQFRLYSFGNDLWGVIHDVFGKDKVYETFRHLITFVDVYNEAVTKTGKTAFKIRFD